MTQQCIRKDQIYF